MQAFGKFFIYTLYLVLFIAAGCSQNKDLIFHKPVIDNTQSPYTKLRGIPMQDTRLAEGFWTRRFDLASNKMLNTLETTMLGDGTANLNRIKYAAGLITEPQHGTPWGDGDNYKWIESMAHVYNITKDPELDVKMDYWIDVIGKAQDADGYISTYIGHDRSMRFQKVNDHELYNMGHLLTAACIHFRSTGKDNFMELARKNADFLYNQWKAEPDHMARYPWNPSVFMGLAEMYRTTREPRYLELLQIMIDNRGSRPNPDRDNRYGGTDQTQDRVPIREETVAVGHAVTGNYYYCGAADLYAETGDKEIILALERIWKDIHENKIDIIVGAAKDRHSESLSPRGDEVHENFANAPFEQPNFYNETCANIGIGMFNYRMFMLTGEAKYTDWTEQMMYNTLNSAIDIEGEHWFYANPLSWEGEIGEKIRQTHGRDPERMVSGHRSGLRWEFMNCYCCPPSVTRTTAKVHNWFYNVADDGSLWINFYGGNQLSTRLADGTKLDLSQTTDYPWDGKVAISIERIRNKATPIYLRIPGWTENPMITVNREEISDIPQPGNYMKIERKWNSGDEIFLDFPMPIRLMEANPRVKSLTNKVAVMRGPVVYCMEFPKDEGGDEIMKNGVFFPHNIQLTPEYHDDYLGGVTVLKGRALNKSEKEAWIENNSRANEIRMAIWAEGELYRPMKQEKYIGSLQGSVEIELIPYYTWANRGLSYMDVWISLAQ